MDEGAKTDTEKMKEDGASKSYREMHLDGHSNLL
jgi:hypothetical protein